MAEIKKPNFGKAVMNGYNKADVDDYIARKEEELDAVLAQKTKLEKRLTDEHNKLKKAALMIEEERTKSQKLTEQNELLSKSVKEFETEVVKLREENAKAQSAAQNPLEKMNDPDYDPELIKEAIMSARAKGKSILADAERKAADIVQQAEESVKEREEASTSIYDEAQEKANGILADAQGQADTLVEEAKGTAEKVIADAKELAKKLLEEAQEKEESLTKNYEEMLSNARTLKADLLAKYKQQEELLQNLIED